MKKLLVLSTALLLALPLGCSLVNSFPDVKPIGEGGSDTGGGTSLGGASGGTNSGGTSSGGAGPGTGGMPAIEPGLIVVSGRDTQKYAVLALSPQTGAELGRIETDDYAGDPTKDFTANAYKGVAHEAERDIWFLVKPTAIRAARFDRGTNKWTLLGSADVTLEPVKDVNVIFAENKLLVYTNAAGQLQALDTSDPAAPKKVGTPQTFINMSETLWRVVAAPTASGMAVFALKRVCFADPMVPCDINVARYNVTNTGIVVSNQGKIGTVPSTFASSSGSLVYDRFNGGLLAAIPNQPSPPAHIGQTTGNLLALGLSNFTPPASPFFFKQLYTANDRLELDPCKAFPILGSTLGKEARVRTLSSADSKFTEEMDWNHDTVQGILFEPATRSILARVANGQSQGILAARVPDMIVEGMPIVKRSGDWKPPSFFPGFGWGVANPKDYVCP